MDLDWNDLNTSEWRVLPCLGKDWACKWHTSSKGYILAATG